MSHAGPPPPPPPPPAPPGGGPPTFQPPAAAPRSRLLLWVVLGVVLALVAAGAVTLVLVAPWDDDTPARDAGGDEGGDESGDDDAEGEPSAEPPADPPAVSDRVTGDRDGDGLGDAQFGLSENFGETFERWTFTSTGSGFESAAEPEEASAVYGQAFADWDGDGEPATLSIEQPADNGDSISFTLVGEETDELEVDLPAYSESDKHLQAVVGDYDGDGRPDVAIATETASCEVSVSVLLGTGSGFSDPTSWAVLTNAINLETPLTSADVDGDGDHDLLGLVPGEPLDADNCESGIFFGPYAGVVLTSNGSGFDVGAQTDAGVEELKDMVGGDFSGDGTPMIAATGFGTTIQILEYDGSGLVDLPDRTIDVGPALEAATTHDGTPELGIEALNVADVDGDGDDDLVVLAHDERAELYYAGVWVLRSDGATFGEPEKWADASDCGEFDSCSGDAVTGTVFN